MSSLVLRLLEMKERKKEVKKTLETQEHRLKRKLITTFLFDEVRVVTSAATDITPYYVLTVDTTRVAAAQLPAVTATAALQ